MVIIFTMFFSTTAFAEEWGEHHYRHHEEEEWREHNPYYQNWGYRPPINNYYPVPQAYPYYAPVAQPPVNYGYIQPMPRYEYRDRD
jgi:hypothetical protein